MGAYRWLVCFLLDKSWRRLEELRAEGQDEFEARNNSQVAWGCPTQSPYAHVYLFILFIQHKQSGSMSVRNIGKDDSVCVCVCRPTTAAH